MPEQHLVNPGKNCMDSVECIILRNTWKLPDDLMTFIFWGRSLDLTLAINYLLHLRWAFGVNQK